jgi:hypothetical protein
MKGVVFTEFLDMVEETYSLAVVEAVIATSDLPSRGAYTAVGTYDSAEMDRLVSALSHEVDTPPADLLQAFGTRLFRRFCEMYPGFFPADQDIGDFLDGLESRIHSEVRKLYPDAATPTVDTRHDADGTIVLTYTSPRELPDLAEGLLRGAIQHFEANVDLSREELGGEPSTTRFTLTGVAS